MEGTDGQIGAVASWDSEHEDVGKGTQTIRKLEPPTLMETDLKFYKPYESEGVGFIKLEKENNGTKITWGFRSQIPYPFNLMTIFSSMEEMDKVWNSGLIKLKGLVKNKIKHKLLLQNV